MLALSKHAYSRNNKYDVGRKGSRVRSYQQETKHGARRNEDCTQVTMYGSRPCGIA